VDVNCSDVKDSVEEVGNKHGDGMVGGSIGELIGGGIDDGSGLANVDVIGRNDGISLFTSVGALST